MIKPTKNRTNTIQKKINDGALCEEMTTRTQSGFMFTKIRRKCRLHVLFASFFFYYFLFIISFLHYPRTLLNDLHLVAKENGSLPQLHHF